MASKSAFNLLRIRQMDNDNEEVSELFQRVMINLWEHDSIALSQVKVERYFQNAFEISCVLSCHSVCRT